jgi:hypothetical protein
MAAHARVTKSFLLEAAAAAMFFLLSTNALSAAQPEIVKVEINSDAQTITALGHSFGSQIGRVALTGSRGSVDMELVVISWGDGQIIAFLPDATPAGTYRLAIVTSGNVRNPGVSDIIDFTIVKRSPGVQGAAGPPGATGQAGPAGPQGADGAQGPGGPQGPVGPQGPTGAQGPIGPLGPQGPAGPQGEQGAVGAGGSGFAWKGSWDSQAQYVSGDVVEHNGSSFVVMVPITGNEPPASPWQLTAAVGEAGAAGPAGPTGPNGGDGSQGAQGPVGAQGPEGPRGADGPQGAIGPIGAPGPQGPAGPAAAVGATAVPLDRMAVTGALQTIPSMVTMTVPPATIVSALVNAEGDLSSTGGPGTQALIELHLVIDGQIVRILRTSVVNLVIGGAPSGWHLGTIQSLPPGQHIFWVEAKTLFVAGGAVATVDLTPGNLSVALLRQ